MRRWFPVVLDGGVALTEWALVEAHLRQCVDCRYEVADLRRATRFQPPSTLERTVRASASLVRATGQRAGRLPDLIRFLGGAVALAWTPSVGTCTRTVQKLLLHVGRALDAIARAHAALVEAYRLTVRATVDFIAAGSGCITLGLSWLARRLSAIGHAAKIRIRAVSVIVLGTFARALSVVVGLAVVASALPGTSGPPRPARMVSDSSAGRALGESFRPPAVAPSVDSAQVVPVVVRPDRPRSSARPAAAPSDGDGPPDAPTPAAPLRKQAASTVDVAGQLSARDLTRAEHDLAALLVGVGGTETDRRPHVPGMTINVVVPQSRYQDFAQGLSRIGSWQLEAARSRLPSEVRVSVRLTK